MTKALKIIKEINKLMMASKKHREMGRWRKR